MATFTTNIPIMITRHPDGTITAEQYNPDKERIAALEAALEVATRGWVVLPEFGEPHCRYCRTLFHGTTPADHAADCPVRILGKPAA